MFRKYKKTISNNNNIVFVYYFKNYYKKYKNKTFNKILKDIIKNINNEPYISNMNIKYIIFYPDKLNKEIENINIVGNNKIIFINDYNKSIIKHLLY
jgi:hypothetical protein